MTSMSSSGVASQLTRTVAEMMPYSLRMALSPREHGGGQVDSREKSGVPWQHERGRRGAAATRAAKVRVGMARLADQTTVAEPGGVTGCVIGRPGGHHGFRRPSLRCLGCVGPVVIPSEQMRDCRRTPARWARGGDAWGAGQSAGEDEGAEALDAGL